MCLLFFAINHHPKYQLILAANRDEYYQRATEPAGFWSDAPHILAGRDLEQGGTWLGITLSGRWAAVTNFREVTDKKNINSRGNLVRNYLTGNDAPGAYIGSIHRHAHQYAGFNLVVGDLEDTIYYSNRNGNPQRLTNRVYGLSNHLLDTPWPKISKGRERFSQILYDGNDLDTQKLFLLLCNQKMAVKDLPDTGVGEEMERLLSSAFITSPEYGTRSSTVILVDHQNQAQFIERSYVTPDNKPSLPENFRSTVHRFTIQRL